MPHLHSITHSTPFTNDPTPFANDQPTALEPLHATRVQAGSQAEAQARATTLTTTTTTTAMTATVNTGATAASMPPSELTVHLSVIHGDIMRQLNGVEAGLAQRITTVEAKQMRLLERVEGVRERLQIPFEYRSDADFGELDGRKQARGSSDSDSDSDSDSETDVDTEEDEAEPVAITDAAAAAAAAVTKVVAIATATATAAPDAARAVSRTSVRPAGPVVPPAVVRTLIFAARTDEPLSTPTRWEVAPPHETAEQREHKREVEAAWDAVLVGWEAPPRVPIRLFTPTLLHTNASILTARPKTQTAHLTTTAATTHGFLSAADFLVIRPDQHDGSDQNSFRGGFFDVR